MTNPNSIPEGNPFSENFSIRSSVSPDNQQESSNVLETRWTEVKKYSEFIARYAGEAQHLEVSKENYYDLYNVAVCLLKAVDSLDPDKLVHTHHHSQKHSYQPPPSSHPHHHHHSHQPPPPPPSKVKLESDLSPSATNTTTTTTTTNTNAHGMPFGSYVSVPSNGANQLDYFYRGPYDTFFLPRYAPEMTMYAPPPPFATSFYTPTPVKIEPPKDSHDSVSPLDDEEEKKSKRKRRKNVCSTKRNLHCLKCGATETPEWRRGPQGEHTLCNACGLHYAKTLKKQKGSVHRDEQHDRDESNGLSPIMNGLSNMAASSSSLVDALSAHRQQEEEEEDVSSPDDDHDARDL